MTVSARSINPKDENFFGEIEGVDLKADLDRAAVEAIEAAMDRFAVCVVRGQFLDDDQQIDFSTRLGELSYAINYGRAQGAATRLRRELYDISNLDEGDDILANDVPAACCAKATGCGTPTAPSFRPIRPIRCSRRVKCRPKAATPNSPICAPPMTRCPTR